MEVELETLREKVSRIEETVKCIQIEIEDIIVIIRQLLSAKIKSDRNLVLYEESLFEKLILKKPKPDRVKTKRQHGEIGVTDLSTPQYSHGMYDQLQLSTLSNSSSIRNASQLSTGTDESLRTSNTAAGFILKDAIDKRDLAINFPNMLGVLKNSYPINSHSQHALRIDEAPRRICTPTLGFNPDKNDQQQLVVINQIGLKQKQHITSESDYTHNSNPTSAEVNRGKEGGGPTSGGIDILSYGSEDADLNDISKIDSACQKGASTANTDETPMYISLENNEIPGDSYSNAANLDLKEALDTTNCYSNSNESTGLISTETTSMSAVGGTNSLNARLRDYLIQRKLSDSNSSSYSHKATCTNSKELSSGLYICNKMVRVNNKSKHLKTHERNVKQQFSCSICPVVSNNKDELMTHMRTHPELLQNRTFKIIQEKEQQQLQFQCQHCCVYFPDLEILHKHAVLESSDVGCLKSWQTLSGHKSLTNL